MGKFNWIDGQAGGTPLSAENLNQMQDNLLQLVFPVGSTYITQENVNPNAILGFGIWERIKGKVCLGLDEEDSDFDAIGNTGGEKTHILTIGEMPKHNHNFLDNNSNEYNSIATMISGGSNDEAQTSGNRKHENIYVNFAGYSQPHNNLQPYEVVGYMWIRRS